MSAITICPHCGANCHTPRTVKALAESEISTQKKYPTDKLIASGAVFVNGDAYLRFTGKHGVKVIYEFVRRGNRWRWVGVGRAEFFQHLHLFASPEI